MWRGAIQQVLISEAELHRRIQDLGQAITTDYQGKDLIFVAVIRGAMMFSADLARAVDLPLTIDCIALSSYGDSHVSSERVHIFQDLTESIAGKHVLIIEDIVDTGLTLQYLWHHLMSRHPANLNISIEFVEGEGLALMLDAKGIAVAAGAACVTKAMRIPPILAAIGLPETLAKGNILLTFGKDNHEGELDYLIETFAKAVSTLREMSPLWDDFQRGLIKSEITKNNPFGAPSPAAQFTNR